MLVNVSWFFLSHRLPLAVEAIHRGWAFHVGTRIHPADDRARLRSAGVNIHALRFARSGWAFIQDAYSIVQIWRLYRRLRPDIVHLVTLKPIIFGGLVARLAGIDSVVAAVPGLGYSFTAKGPVARVRRNVILRLMKLSMRHPRSVVICQNPEDRDVLVTAGVIDAQRGVLIRGSGVDVEEFRSGGLPDGRSRVLLASRMLREKGVHIFVDAARRLKESGLEATFLLAGAPDPDNPGSIDEAQLRAWHASGIVQWLGHVEDMPSLLQSIHVFCLPTYYGEGVPKVLIEAAAAGRPIVATDVAGCREIVVHDRNGLLVPPRDSISLGMALERLVKDRGLCERFGQVGASLVDTQFRTDQIVRETFEVYENLLSPSGQS